jgi:hypothetical protein
VMSIASLTAPCAMRPDESARPSTAMRSSAYSRAACPSLSHPARADLMAIASAAHCAAAAVAITRKQRRVHPGWPSRTSTPAIEALWPSTEWDATVATD